MTEESGRAFEERALAVARAIYDPSGHQGSTMFDDAERDAVFTSETAIVAFEFTQLPKKEKALKDAQKLASMLKSLAKEPANQFKSVQGYFVTEQEPTAEQRDVVAKISRDSGIPLKTLSISVLQRQLIDGEEYLRNRLAAPFGSTAFRLPEMTERSNRYVEPALALTDGSDASVNDVVAAAEAGDKFVLSADFGAGKSEALKQVFLRLRKRYFKNTAEHRLPVHINLRDCYGLRSASEVLRRHAEEIGFSNDRSLIAAWRAGAVDLLLDGFDEVIPSRWGGGARDLRQVRWQALEAVRRLVEESPIGCGIVIAGRPQYFSDSRELLNTLGLSERTRIATLIDFDERRIAELIDETTVVLPDWVPSRPLLLRYLASTGALQSLASTSAVDEATTWLELIRLLAKREADRISTVTPERVQELIARIATVARAGDGAGATGSGEVSLSAMREAFKDVCGYEADEEGLQLLLRLPGLASEVGSDNAEEMRTFVDTILAEAAYGFDLAKYAVAPYGDHPLTQGVSWAANTGSLAASVASASMIEAGFDPAHVAVAINARLDNDRSDAILLDLLGVADAADVNATPDAQPFFRETLISHLALTREKSYLAASIFRDCLIDVLDLSDADSHGQFPQFQECLIGQVVGAGSVPEYAVDRFVGCDISRFEPAAETTSAILNLKLDTRDRVALVILKKVYMQAGAGRRESALVRGLPLEDRGLVPEIVDELAAANYVTRSTRRATTLVLPVKGRRSLVASFVNSPNTFAIKNL